MSHTVWDTHYSSYLAALEKARLALPQDDKDCWDYWGWNLWLFDYTEKYFSERLAQPNKQTLPDFSHLSYEDIQWLVHAFENEQRKWFSIAVIANANFLPETLFPALVRAAINEKNPSLTRPFAGNASRFGLRRIVEALLEYAEQGTESEKFGATSSLYWVLIETNIETAEKCNVLPRLEVIADNPQYSDELRSIVVRFMHQAL